jgi:fucose permease
MSIFHNEAEPLLNNRSDDNIPQLGPDKAAVEKPDTFATARLVGCCISALSTGWHDGCIGALIPYLQYYYGSVTDERVSLVFVGSFTGYTLASLLNVTLSTRLGLSRLIILGAFIQGVASGVIALGPPFIAIAVCYVFAGFGLALQDAQFNTYIARLPGAATKLGIIHAIYGVGALTSPIVATLLMVEAKVDPPLFYLTNLAWCLTTLTMLLIGFGIDGSSDGESQSDVENNEGIASIRTVVSARVVWASLLFMSLYTGAEAGEAGWVVSFLMRVRDGGHISGYASAAFYAGLTSGRVALLPLTAWIKEKKAVALYAIIALALQVLVWASPLYIVDFVAIAICGFVMGPIYPVIVSLITKGTPYGYHPGALSLLACFGQSGSALFPFLVGLLADIYGIKVLQPVLVTLFVVMIMLWQLVPSPTIGLQRSLLGSEAASIDENLDGTIPDDQ